MVSGWTLTLACWGYNSRRLDLDPPTGQFSAVSAGGWHSCGLRRNDHASGNITSDDSELADTVVCWKIIGGHRVDVEYQ